jgi:hypothetical protein
MLGDAEILAVKPNAVDDDQRHQAAQENQKEVSHCAHG